MVPVNPENPLEFTRVVNPLLEVHLVEENIRSVRRESPIRYVEKELEYIDYSHSHSPIFEHDQNIV